MARTEPDTSALIVPTSPIESRLAVLTRVRSVFRGAPVFSLIYLTAAVICAIFAPLIAPMDPIQNDPVNMLAPPSLSGQLMGTDQLKVPCIVVVLYPGFN